MSTPGLDPADAVALAGFLGVILAALIWEAVRHARANTPHARIRRRALALTEANRSQLAPDRGGARAAPVPDSRLALLLRTQGRMLSDKGGPWGAPLLALGMVAAALTAAAPVLTLHLSPWLLLPGVPAAALLAGGAGRALIVGRYRQRFLEQFPEALELIIRAVSAGVPAHQAIQMAGEEMAAPLGREFARMGHALHLGMDPGDVLDAAARRIGIADFRFFAVCLQLQRETGGPLAETLENLAYVIRVRRDTRLKTRALTAQSRAASKVISLVPFALVGVLELGNSHYLDILFFTAPGQRLLWVAAGLLFLGLAVINHMARLEI